MNFQEFVEKYFSFIVLGLVLTIGYIIWRVFGSKKTNREQVALEDRLHVAEEEFKRERLAKSQTGHPGAEAEEDVLDLSPEEKVERERIRRMAQAEQLSQEKEKEGVEKTNE